MDDAATVTTAKAGVDAVAAANAPKTYTLTTGADVLAMSANNDTVTAAVGTLGDTDIIQDGSTTDSDTINASINNTTATGVKPTLKNIENVNLTWTSNADMEFNAVNSTGNTFNLTGTALAFTGSAVIDNLGTNNVKADAKITGTLTLEEVVSATVNAGSATAIVLTDTTPTVVGAKSTVDITISKNVNYTNDSTGTAGVQNVTLRSTLEGAKVTAQTAVAGGDIDTQLTIAGDKSLIYKGLVTGEKIVNSLTAGTLTVQANDAAGAIDISKVSANTIEFMNTFTTTTVADNQQILLKTANFNGVLAAASGVTNGTVNIKNQYTSAITKVDMGTSADLSKLNFEADEASTLSLLVLGADDNVFIKGDSATTITAMTGSTGAISIDASALTGAFTVTSTSVNNIATGIIGSSTAKNTISTAATTANATVITGSADDTITAATTSGKLTITAGDGKNTISATALDTGTATVTSGTGNDTIDLSGLTSGKATVTSGAGDDKVTLAAIATATTEFTFDGGAGTDTLAIGAVDISAAKVFSLTGVENMAITTGATLAGSMLSGGTYSIAAAAANGTLNIDVVNPNALTAITTDLDALVFSTSTSSNFSSVVIDGLANVADTIYGTTMADTITAGAGAKDVINISAGGNDIIKVNTIGDSTYASGADKMESITGFNAVVTSTAYDRLQFATDIIGEAATDKDVKAAITGYTGTEVVNASISAGGILTIAGADAGSIDTLIEWTKVAKLALEATTVAAGGTALADGETVAFQFNGNTYVYNVGDGNTTADTVDSFDIVELVGVTGITALAFTNTAAANTIVVA